MKRWFLCAAIVLWAASVISAQTASGAIQGMIFDQSGGIIVGARLALTEQQTNQKRSQGADANGFYQFRALPPGTYRIDVEQSKFAKKTVVNIPLQVAEIRTIDVSLNPGTLEQSVTVESSAQMLQVADSSLSQVIDQRRVQELPLNGRNMLQLTSPPPARWSAQRAAAPSVSLLWPWFLHRRPAR
jgi:hypothetical protein